MKNSLCTNGENKGGVSLLNDPMKLLPGCSHNNRTHHLSYSYSASHPHSFIQDNDFQSLTLHYRSGFRRRRNASRWASSCDDDCYCYTDDAPTNHSDFRPGSDERNGVRRERHDDHSYSSYNPHDGHASSTAFGSDKYIHVVSWLYGHCCGIKSFLLPREYACDVRSGHPRHAMPPDWRPDNWLPDGNAMCSACESWILRTSCEFH